jgi:hypothetical protein
MPKQKVHLSRTQSGRPGLFTGHYLAWHLTAAQFHAFAGDRPALRRYVEKLGFELEEPEDGRAVREGTW